MKGLTSQLYRYNKLSLDGTIPFEDMFLDSSPKDKTVVRRAPVYACSLEDACDNSDPAGVPATADCINLLSGA